MLCPLCDNELQIIEPISVDFPDYYCLYHGEMGKVYIQCQNDKLKFISIPFGNQIFGIILKFYLINEVMIWIEDRDPNPRFKNNHIKYDSLDFKEAYLLLANHYDKLKQFLIFT